MTASAVTLPGTLWGIATYFNPVGYRNKVGHYRLFREASKKQGLKLIVVEAAIGKAPFELQDDDAEQVVRLRTDTILWQKERMFNVALKHLPADCDKVVWMDTDVLFASDSWVQDLVRKLEECVVVQPFEQGVQLAKDRQTILPAQQWIGESVPRPGSIAWWLRNGRPRDGSMSGHPGYALAARRSLLDRFGFYDLGILGSGDAIIIGAFFGIDPRKNAYIHVDQRSLLDHAALWAAPVTAAVNGSVGTVPGTVFHLWHGLQQKRYYVERYKLLDDYDPLTDVRVDAAGGCLEWCSDKPYLHDRVRDYFWMRDEDGHSGIQCVADARIIALEQRHTLDLREIDALRQKLHVAEARCRELQAIHASCPGPILRRLCSFLDRCICFILPRHSRLRSFIRNFFLRLFQL